jgi:endoglucanase
LDYAVNVSATGTYKVNFRVATPNTGVQFQLRKNDGTVLATVTAPNTGWWHIWQTVTATVNLSAGPQTLRIYTADAKGTGWNFNYMEFTPVATAPVTNTHIEAEQYTGMYGIQTENTNDAGGGLNVGWQDNNDWMDYNVNMPASGTYTINFRVASMFTGAQFQMRKQDGSVLANITVPNTGNFQSWQTVSASVTLPAGQQTFRIITTAANGGWNLNWMDITNGVASGKIEAENYSGMYGIQTENTSDAGGGQNVGWQDNNDWMDYNVTTAAAGSYHVNFRVASMFTGATFQVRKQDGTVLATLTVPNTGNFQNWQNISASISLPAGSQTLRIVTTQANGGWNLNWFEINPGVEEQNLRARVTEETTVEIKKENIEVFPNPAKDRILVRVNNELHGNMIIQLYSISGSLQKQVNVIKPAEGQLQIPLNIDALPAGSYILKASMGKWNQTSKIIKQ